MSRTYRRRGQRHEYRWVLRDWKRKNFVLIPVLLEARSEEGRRAIARFHSDAESTVRSTHVTVVPVSFVTADRFDRIAATVRAKGRPIPTNDIWIAAHAMETGADLFSDR